jgi:hypothetical protein
MRTCARTIGGILAGVTLVLVGSPVAQANPDPEGDDANFLSQAHALGGFTLHSDVNLISAGRSVCYELRLGNRAPEEVSAKIARSLVVTEDQARQFSLLSADEWCPQWSGLFSS